MDFFKSCSFRGPCNICSKWPENQKWFYDYGKSEKKKNIFLPSQKLLKLFRAQYVPYSKVYLKL